MLKTYDFEDRTLEYAITVRTFLRHLPKTISNHEDGKQLIRASGSVGANYIESKESLGKRDRFYGLKLPEKKQKKVVIG
ncbi:MAG TPA: four helix bundle protein [Phycisphaerae bacterium]|nr:four helix bundle protein [Phycisphaerae bacterium]